MTRVLLWSRQECVISSATSANTTAAVASMNAADAAGIDTQTFMTHAVFDNIQNITRKKRTLFL